MDEQNGSVFSKEEFSPVSVKSETEMRVSPPLSLDQIILSQQDEPNQKNCIFMLNHKTREELEKYY